MTTIQSNSRRTITIVLAVLITLGFTAAAVAPAAASHDGGDNDTLSDLFTTSDDGTYETVKAVAGGIGARFSHGLSSINPFSDPPPASDFANETSDVFNQHSTELVQHANQRDVAGWFAHYSDRSNDVDVVAVTFTDANGGESTRYLVAEYNATSGEYESVKMVSDTQHTVDEPVKLGPRASEHAAGDLDEFLGEYQPGDDLTKSYRRGMAAKYSGDVESPLIPDVGLSDIMRGL
jgi:hypothetical protein